MFYKYTDAKVVQTYRSKNIPVLSLDVRQGRHNSAQRPHGRATEEHGQREAHHKHFLSRHAGGDGQDSRHDDHGGPAAVREQGTGVSQPTTAIR